MTRRAFIRILAITTLTVTVVLWIQQALWPGGLYRRNGSAGFRIISRDSQIWFDRIEDDRWAYWEHEGWSFWFDAFYGDPVVIWSSPGTLWNRLGFARFPSPTRTRYITPLWPLYLCGIASAWILGSSMWARSRIRLRVKHGLCPTCGYDLRATADRCPECGDPIPHRAERAPESLE